MKRIDDFLAIIGISGINIITKLKNRFFRVAILTSIIIFIMLGLSMLKFKLQPIDTIQNKNIKTEIREALAVNAIPAIINPKFESVKATAYSQDELVFFIKIGDQIKGYPSSILNWHEIVNDEIGGIKIIVTFDPISYTAAAYERNNSIFGVSGKLYKNNLVMYSNETDTLWSQLTGIQLQEIKSGETQDSANVISLKQIPILRITFKEFNKQFPNGLILSHDQGFNRDYNENPYDDYLKSDDIGIFGDTASDERLEQKKIIYGIHIGSHSRAYSQDILDDGITNHFISDIPILIFNDNKPTATPYHNVNNLTKSAITTAVEISIPCKLSNPTKLPSVTPIPAGKNDKTPKINEAIYVEIIVRKDSESISNAKKIK